MPRKPLVGEVSLEELLERLSFPEEGLQQAVLEQAKLFMEAADFRIAKMRAYQGAKRELDGAKTQISLRLRAKYAVPQKGKKALTERHLTDLVEQTQTVKVASAALDKAERLEEWAKLLLEAYRQRRDSLKIMAQFAYVEENFRVGVGDRMKETRERLKSRLPEKEEEEV